MSILSINGVGVNYLGYGPLGSAPAEAIEPPTVVAMVRYEADRVSIDLDISNIPAAAASVRVWIQVASGEPHPFILPNLSQVVTISFDAIGTGAAPGILYASGTATGTGRIVETIAAPLAALAFTGTVSYQLTAGSVAGSVLTVIGDTWDNAVTSGPLVGVTTDGVEVVYTQRSIIMEEGATYRAGTSATGANDATETIWSATSVGPVTAAPTGGVQPQVINGPIAATGNTAAIPSDFAITYAYDETQTSAWVMMAEITNTAHPAHRANAGGAVRLRWHTASPDLGDSTLGGTFIKAPSFAVAGSPYEGKWLQRDHLGNFPSWADRAGEVGAEYNLHLRHSLAAEGDVTTFSAWGTGLDTAIARPTTGGTTPPPEPPPTGLLSYTSAPEQGPDKRAVQYPPSDNGQNPLCLFRSKSNPDVVAFGFDIGLFHIALDNGRSWRSLACRGIRVPHGYSGEIHPTDPKTWIVLCGTRFGNNPGGGIYKSTNGAMDFAQVLSIPDIGEPRRIMHLVAYAPSNPRYWFVAVGAYPTRYDDRPGAHGLRWSDDTGDTWRQSISLPSATFGSAITGIRVDPSNNNTVYLWSDVGLFRITNARSASATVTRLSGSGGLPSGKRAEGDIHISDDGQTLIIGMSGGVYRSTNRGSSWSTLLSWSDCIGASVNPAFPNAIIAFSRSSARSRYTTNGGSSWANSAGEAMPDESNSNAYQTAIAINEPMVSWDPRKAGRATGVANSKLHQTDNGGALFRPASFYWTGVQHSPWAGEWGFHETDPQAYILSAIDLGPLITWDGGRTLEKTSARAQLYGGSTATSSQIKWGSAVSTVLFPDKRRILSALGREPSSRMCYSDDAGANWAVVQSADEDWFVTGYDAGDPRQVFSWRRKSNNYGAPGSWSTLNMPNSTAMVIGISRKVLSSTGKCVLYALTLRSTGSPIFVSFDWGATWTAITSPSFALNSSGTKRTVFRVHPTNPLKFITRNSRRHIREWTINSSGVLQSSRDFDVLQGVSTPSWFEVTNAVYDGFNPQVMYARCTPADTALNDYVLFRSQDAGANWENLTWTFPVLGGEGLEVSHLTGVCYVASVKGMFALKPPYAVPTPNNTVDLIQAAYPNWDSNRFLLNGWTAPAP